MSYKHPTCTEILERAAPNSSINIMEIKLPDNPTWGQIVQVKANLPLRVFSKKRIMRNKKGTEFTKEINLPEGYTYSFIYYRVNWWGYTWCKN